MRFGLYLLNRELITADQLIQALKKQEEDLPPFGQLAIEEGMLSVRDVFKVLRVQSDFALEQFGQTAIDLDLLDRQQVAELLLLQSDRKRTLSDVLVEIGAVNEAECREELAAFRKQQEEHGAKRTVEVIRTIAPRAPHPVTSTD